MQRSEIQNLERKSNKKKKQENPNYTNFPQCEEKEREGT